MFVVVNPPIEEFALKLRIPLKRVRAATSHNALHAHYDDRS
jgi:hypothetical protein